MTATRLAGKALGEFFRSITPVVSSVVEQAVLDKLAAKYSPTVEKRGVYPPRESAEMAPEKRGRPSVSLQEDKIYPESASTRVGKFVNKVGAENIAKVAGAAAPVAAIGGIVAGAAGISQLITPRENIYAQSQYSLPLRRQGTPVAYSNQQYMPGMSPMTNQTAADALLEQQKFQHQLKLIEARQAAQQGVGIGGRTSGGLDIMGLSQQVFTPASY